MVSKSLNRILDDLNQWTRYKKSLCESCVGSCCYLPVEITLNELYELKFLDYFYQEESITDQIKKALTLPFILRYTPSSQKFTLRTKINGSCYFLTPQGQCSIYTQRFKVCRDHPKVGPKPNYCAYFPINSDKNS